MIDYAVAEVPVEGYSPKVTGDAERGFTVTNTSTAKVSVPVEKKWVGPAAEKATVRLLADGEDAGQSIELNESNGWKGSFKGLPKCSESGSVIDYAVAEVPVEGYSPKVTGDAERGFTVTNTSTAKVSVPSRRSGSARRPRRPPCACSPTARTPASRSSSTSPTAGRAPSRACPSTPSPAP